MKKTASIPLVTNTDSSQKNGISVKTLRGTEQGVFEDKRSDDDYFDDCPICQAMKKADQQNRDLTLQELESAFQEAKRLGHMVVTKDDMLNEDHPEKLLSPSNQDPWFDEIEAWTNEEIDEYIRDQEEQNSKEKK